MPPTAQFRLLAITNNARGDLFTRLVSDLFFALGYDELKFDVSKTGREIDIQGSHRLEPRRLIAECKAHKDKIGGSDLNKFLGVAFRERDRHKDTPVVAYFVSLSGFRETGKEQEETFNEQNRNILIDGQKAIAELIRARIIINQETATEQAGRCYENSTLSNAELDGVELVGHQLGYLWIVFYSQNKQRTHFTLIHADGTPLANPIAQEIILLDKQCGGSLHELDYLSPSPSVHDRLALSKSTVDRYRQWIVAECGDIHLDGLPADADLSTFRMRLERLFVPLRVISNEKQVGNAEDSSEGDIAVITTVGEFLTKHSRFSLLAKPGGGKSTLLKRLAVAYADKDRLKESDDGLPEKDWLPLLLRCRELRDRAHRPILELLNDLPQHAGMNEEETKQFTIEIDEALRSGQALLLVDGLDEISNEGTRATFANNLRTFLAMFPQAAMVVTSREAGYRHVAGVIASTCKQVRLAPFNEPDVKKLCESWHVEVVADNETVRSEAIQLANTIWQNRRIRVLTENPLMLTTLLVIRRCVGELPTRRVELYREAVKVLIRTWNTEGFEPMDLEETLAQLSYVACNMMYQGIQQVGHKQLLDMLKEAKNEMEAELQFTRISPEEFIKRIEYRSSLLMQVGYERLNGELQPVYEFRHLTFQEYLAARGIVEEQYPGRNEEFNLVELLEPHFKEERWREVIPLGAVLAGRKATRLIERLTAACNESNSEPSNDNTDKTDRVLPVTLLKQCLLDEVQVTPAALRSALKQISQNYKERGSDFCWTMRRGKFGEVFQEVTESAYFGMKPGWDKYLSAMSDIAVVTEFKNQNPILTDKLSKSLNRSLNSGDRIKQAHAAFKCMNIAYNIHTFKKQNEQEPIAERLQPLYDSICNLLSPKDPPLALAASWALAWFGEIKPATKTPQPEIILQLYHLWRHADSKELRRFASWAFAAQPRLPRNAFAQETWGDCDNWIKLEQKEGVTNSWATLAWYRQSPWNDKELAQKISEISRILVCDDVIIPEILATLGEPGRIALEKWGERKSDFLKPELIKSDVADVL